MERGKMRLPDEAKAFLVCQLAMFATPTEAAKAVKERYGLEIDRHQAFEYNPEGRGGNRPGNLSRKWRVLFWTTRRKFLKEVNDVAIAHRAYRLRRLDGMLRVAETRGDLALAARLLKQAAREMGDAFTNKARFEHSHKGRRVARMTDQQRHDTILAIVSRAKARSRTTPIES
jgi:hypothetical protein